MDIQSIIDDPKFGLTEADFKAWPMKGGINRSSKLTLLQHAFDENDLGPDLLVYAIGECTLYNNPSERWESSANRNKDVLIAVHGEARQYAAADLHVVQGMFKPKPQSVCIGGYDGWEATDEVVTEGFGDIDLQFYDGSTGMCRIGFGYWHHDRLPAQKQAETIIAAIERCRAGQMPR